MTEDNEKEICEGKTNTKREKEKEEEKDFPDCILFFLLHLELKV